MRGESLTIIAVNWNGSKWFEKLFKTLEQNIDNNDEVIIVDNNSTDSSVEIISRNYPFVKVVKNKENLGFAGGVNIGIDHASNNLIMLINTDTWVDENFINSLYSEFKSRNLDVISPMEADYVTGEKRKPYITSVDILGHPVFLSTKNNNKKPFYLSGVCLMFYREFYLTTGGLDESFFMYCEEVDWFWRLNLIGSSFDYAKDVYINHFGAGSTGNGLKENVFLWRNENTLKMLIKNYPIFYQVLILPLAMISFSIESATFFLIGKRGIAKTYASALISSVLNYRKIRKSRFLFKQSNINSNAYVISKMYHGNAKLHHLIEYIGMKK